MSQFIEMFGVNPLKKKISEICDVRGGSTPARTNRSFWDNGTVSWFTVEDIYEQGHYIFNTRQHITELATKKTFVYPIDTILICCTASVGEYAITKKEMASNQQFNGMMIRDKSIMNPEFLLYVASTLKDTLLRQAGKTTISFVSRSKLEEIEIPVPGIDNQNKFVAIKHQADKSEFGGSKSQFIEMIKDKQPNGKIGDLVDTNIKSVKKTHDVDDAIEYIDISSIDSVSRSISETTNYVVKSAPSRAQQCVEYGDILVSTVRPINRNIAVVTKESPNLVASTGFCVLRPKEEEYREYLLSVVLTDKYTQKMCDKASGGLYPAINNGDVLSYEVFIPDKEMLTKISTIYHQADKSEYALRSKIDAIDNDIKSFINENMKRIEYRYTLGKNTFIIMDGSICKVNPIFV